jgi:hypothetical protein
MERKIEDVVSPKILADFREQVLEGATIDPDCPRCNGTGMVGFVDYSHRKGSYRPCDCTTDAEDLTLCFELPVS